jgi:hypothetical protein
LKLEAVEDGAIEHLHGFELEAVKKRAHLFPESFLGSGFFENGLEKGAAELLGLIDQEGLCGADSYVALIQQTSFSFKIWEG